MRIEVKGLACGVCGSSEGVEGVPGRPGWVECDACGSCWRPLDPSGPGVGPATAAMLSIIAAGVAGGAPATIDGSLVRAFIEEQEGGDV